MTVNWEEVVAITGILTVLGGCIGAFGSLYLKAMMVEQLKPIVDKLDEHEKSDQDHFEELSRGVGHMDTRLSVVEARLSIGKEHY